MYSCCITGHRPMSLKYGFDEEHKDCIKLKSLLQKSIVRLITKYDVNTIRIGGALGVDIWTGIIVLELKREYPVFLDCVLPFPDQTEKWNAQLIKSYLPRYNRLLKECDNSLTTSDRYFKDSTGDAYDRRNQYMVDNSDFVLSVWNGQPSGTGKTTRYAKAQGKNVLLLTPIH